MHIVRLYGFDIDGGALYTVIDTLSDYNSSDYDDVFTVFEGAQEWADHLNGHTPHEG